MKNIDKKNIRDIISLTPMQEGMLFFYLKNPEDDLHFEQLTLGISGEVNVDLCEKAWKFVIDSNEMLRTEFQWKNLKKPVQIILKQHQPEFECLDKKNREEQKFDLTKVPFRITLFKLGENTFEMRISNHHIIYDGWSNAIILGEFFNAYNDLIGNKIPVKPVKSSFKLYLEWLRDRDLNELKSHWKSYLRGFDTVTELPYKKRYKEEGTGEGENYRFEVNADFTTQLEEFAQGNRVTPASVFYLAWGVLLQKYSDSGDVVFGTTVSGRSAKIKGIENMVGLFINTLPLRLKSSPQNKLINLLRNLNTDLITRETYESTPLVDIKECSEIDQRHELFDSILIVENYPLDGIAKNSNNSLTITSYSISEKTNYDIAVGIVLSEKIEFNVSYKAGLFDQSSIIKIFTCFHAILNDILRHPGKEISSIDIISEEEKELVLYTFNQTAADNPVEKTLPQLFEEQAAGAGDAVAVIADWEFNSSYKTHRNYITYTELNRRADRVAGLLIEKGARPDTIVAFIVEPSVEMAVGILGILKSGAAYLPIQPGSPEDRINYMLTDSGAEVLLTHQEVMDLTDDGVFATCKPRPELSVDNLAYVIYTSGTTGRPKGVAVEHRGIANFVSYRISYYNFSRRDVTLQLLSFAFDGFAACFYPPLFSGGKLVLTPAGKINDYHYISELIKGEGVTNTALVPAMYEMLLDSAGTGRLTSIRFVTLAAEKASRQLIEKSRKFHPTISLYNEYGPTEASVCATVNSKLEPENTTVIGNPIANVQIYILDSNLDPVPVGIQGELYIAGAGTARGYINRPELTADKFLEINRSYKTYMSNKTHTKKEMLYRTGDMARWLADGNIEFLGRIDGQVKIRGFRVELGEIECAVMEEEHINRAVVVHYTLNTGDNYLCAYIVSAGDIEIDIPAVKRNLARKLPAYMIPAYFQQIDAVPLTPTGKIDRKALPKPGIETSIDYTPPGDDLEKQLAAIWSAVLGIDERQIGIDSNFFSLGGHSLKAARVSLSIHKILGVKVPVDILFEIPCIRELAAYIKQTGPDVYVPISPAEKREYYPVSAAQKRLFIAQHMELESLAYNVPNVVRLEGGFSRSRLEQTFTELIHRHESFRTSFEMIDDEPVQIIHDDVEFELETPDNNTNDTSNDENSLVDGFVRPFDLSRAPLLRIGLIELPGHPTPGSYLLIMDMHHIIGDFVSMSILVKEFFALYRGDSLSPVTITYKDFSLWREQAGPVEDMKQQEAYWLKQFEERVPVLDLPLDFDRPAVQRSEGAVFRFQLETAISKPIKDMASSEDVTLFMLFLAVFNILLAKICDQENIPVGTPVAGRGHADLQQVIGLFVNMLILKNRPSPGKTFTDFLREVKKKALEAYENQDYPYEELVDKLSAARDSTRNALFDVVFVWEDPEIDLGNKTLMANETVELRLIPCKLDKSTAPFDIVFTGTEDGETMSFLINYRTSLFKRETIELIAANFHEIISAVVSDREIKLEDIVLSHRFTAVRSDALMEDSGDFGF